MNTYYISDVPNKLKINTGQIGSGHNFFIFSLSEKFFSNLEMAERIKIIDIKRFDENWRLEGSRLLQSL